MNFVEIYDFILNSQSIKFINFGFTPNKSRNLTSDQKARKLYTDTINYIDRFSNATQSTEMVVFGEALITAVLNNSEQITIKRATNSTEFYQIKRNILAQLNSTQTVN